ncbi:MAG: hypothetical protein U0264_01470 [Candidatus Kapaibacterium sp.]
MTKIYSICFVVLGIVIFSGCYKRYRLDNYDIAFNPYKYGDTLLFKSNEIYKDTMIVVSIDRHVLKDRYTLLFGDSWEMLCVNTKRPDNEGMWGDILDLRVERNGAKTIWMQFHVDDANWYGFQNADEDSVARILRLPKQLFKRGSISLNDVCEIVSTDTEYRDREDFIDKLYWSKSQGLVGFDKLNGEKWLVEKRSKNKSN